MKVCVLGLWHLGSVTAAGLAELGHDVVGFDFDERRVAQLRAGIAPVHEPGLEDLIKRGMASDKLRFSSSLQQVVRDVEVLWIACDTPVDGQGNADLDFVGSQIVRAVLETDTDALVLVSSQLPVGSVRRLERAAALYPAARQLRVAYSPENLRLGSAVNDFLHPHRIVVGVRSSRDRQLLSRLLGSITESIEWMSVESAEMTKHAINGFLATSVAFANEIASICESVGADAKEVERGLKGDRRIGPRAYLAPGGPFAGGTLARDLVFLNRAATEGGVTTPLLSSVLASNDCHKSWVKHKLRALFEQVSPLTVTVWGLAYKPGTDTLRGSGAAELCEWLIGQGASINVHDALVKELPPHWRGTVERFDHPLAALRGAHALVVAADSPAYRCVSADQLRGCADRLVVLDADRVLHSVQGGNAHNLDYVAVGMPAPKTWQP
jgi:UDPglucose 6-dehydrogenase